MDTTDFLVIGGGVVGITVARQLRLQFPDASVTLIEKENDVGQHASGRNSGVLHAGFYYTPDSLKARFTKQGNSETQAYCAQKGIPVNRCGKLVVATQESDLPGLDLLLQRGRANEIQVQEITAQEAKEIEPRVKTLGRALYSPTTASVNPSAVVSAMRADAEAEGVIVRRGTRYLQRRSAELIRTSLGDIATHYVINAGGLYADRIARDFGCSANYRILPFKGLYLYSNEPVGALRTNIYPVPNLKNPFLGVHFTVTVDGAVKIGPTAIPAFWRENYNGMYNFRLSELSEILYRQASLFVHSDFDFKSLVVEEMAKYSKAKLVRLAQALIEDIRSEAFTKWGKPGIRAQLLDVRRNRLEMDFVIESGERSLHVLNAVSPAFTCALPFARHVVDIVSQKIT